MTNTEKHFYELSEIYLAAYQDHTRPSILAMMMMGVVVEMRSDIALYLKKNPNSVDKVKKQQDRIKILVECLDAFTVATDRNLQITKILTGYYDREKSLREENEKLSAELAAIKKALEND
ncbi:hypothetical protein G7074_18045 [Pedobacter sp. HDW13]|uniref:hypothetical protein n=1 Tax=Pedobacter sp. HDW13 TaxID=2714940 RepID=UPI00140A040D|nr:hypothetical protein [Pedobacter sp. HDW13]QIL41001.1 hypothetical protein G7074_18045 [Pedobacter sp. HDW13]